MKPIRILLLLALLSGPCLTARAQKVEPLMLEDSASWSMVLLPDPQSYVKYGLQPAAAGSDDALDPV